MVVGSEPDRPDLEPWVRSYRRRREALQRLASTIDMTVTPSSTLRDTVVGEGFPADRIRIVRQGLDPAPFEGIASERQPVESRLRLGFVGTLAPHKGVHVLVDAVRRLPSDRVSLSIWGPSGQHRDYARGLEDSIREHPNIRMRGSLAKPDVPSVYREIDVSCVPSLWNECCPLTIQESLMAGVPSVVSGFGGMAELIRDGVDGLHAVAGDVDDWERVLRQLIERPDLPHVLASGIRPVRTMQEHVGEILALYGSITG